LPNIAYTSLSSTDMLEAVEQFYGEYYFRTRVIWRVVKKAIFNSEERQRLYHEAREYLELRAKRKKTVARERSSQPGPPLTDSASR